MAFPAVAGHQAQCAGGRLTLRAALQQPFLHASQQLLGGCRRGGCPPPRAASVDNNVPRLTRMALSAPPNRQQQQQQQQQLTGPADTQPVVPAVPAVAAAAPQPWWSKAWGNVPPNTKLVVAATLGLMISNMGKVNMSVAIVPLSAEAGWSSSVSGLVQAFFYTGYMLACIPGGYLASSTGGRTVLPQALGIWSLATALAPLAAVSVPTLALSRFIVGAGQGVAPSAVVDMVARTVPPTQRASATTTSFAGLHLGTVVGLLAAPVIVENLGWQSLFYIYGGLGFVWYGWFEGILMADIAKSQPQLADNLVGSVGSAAATAAAAAAAASSGEAQQQQEQRPVPYRAFLRSKQMQALMVTHFCNNWYYFTLLSWLPTYYVEALHMDLSSASLVSMAPALTGIAASAVAGRFADGLLAGGMPLSSVRKIVQAISMVGAASFMVMGEMTSDPNQTVFHITAALTIACFTLAGLFCTPNDLSTKYAGALLGISNTCGALGAVMGIAAVGVLLDLTHSWDAALYAPCIAFLLAGAYAYIGHCSNEPVDYDSRDDSRFGFETKLYATLASVGIRVPWAEEHRLPQQQEAVATAVTAPAALAVPSPSSSSSPLQPEEDASTPLTLSLTSSSASSDALLHGSGAESDAESESERLEQELARITRTRSAEGREVVLLSGDKR